MFESILKEFKNHEAPEAIYPLTQNPKLVVCMLAWRGITIRRVAKDSHPPDGLPEQWKWLWEQVAYDEIGLGSAIGEPPSTARRLHDQLRAHRLVYPDGTIHGFGEQYARTVIMERLQGKPKGK